MADQTDLGEILHRIRAEVEPHLRQGRVADYIPALARVKPTKFGIAVATVDGAVFTAGDAAEPFSIQSVSKVFTLTLALGKIGNDLWKRVGREPSGSAFNSIVQLERERGIPRNPFINAGAIATTDAVLEGRPPGEAVEEILGFVRRLAGDETVSIDEEVARSEAETGHRNRSLGHFMKAFRVVRNPVEDVLSVYFRQCAIAMTCAQLARAGLFLAADGRDPILKKKVIRAERARRINAVMLTCGHYDASGDFAYRVGLPGKSGVGGGILAIVPGRASVAVWSPGLNANGNSLCGTMALERLADAMDWTIFRGRR